MRTEKPNHAQTETRVGMQPMAGYPHDPQLRARIQAYSPDEPGVVFPFSARLARENGWTRPFAERVVEEYRRFVYLAVTSGHPVTPSVQVDQAWHLHLTYTRSYWDEMCGRVLGRPLHHGPTRGGRAEGDKFVDWYARTLDSYRSAFGHAPPPDLWPPSGERFARAARIRQVSGATHWIIPKPRLRGRALATAVALGALLAVAACTGDATTDGVVLFGMIAAGAIAAAFVIPALGQPPARRRRHRRGGDAVVAYDPGGSSRTSAERHGDGDGAGDGGGDGCGGCGGCGG